MPEYGVYVSNPTLRVIGLLSEEDAGGAITALPAVSEACVPEALALLEAAAGDLDGSAADSGPDALAANKRLLAVCMRSLPDMLSGVSHMQAGLPSHWGLAYHVREHFRQCKRVFTKALACVHNANARPLNVT